MATLTLDEETLRLLDAEARRAGEPIEYVAARVIRSSLNKYDEATSQPAYTVTPFELEIEALYPGMSASAILEAMDVEEYKEKLERARHESASLRS